MSRNHVVGVKFIFRLGVFFRNSICCGHSSGQWRRSDISRLSLRQLRRAAVQAVMRLLTMKYRCSDFDHTVPLEMRPPESIVPTPRKCAHCDQEILKEAAPGKQ
jgi:hypothetical protein